MAAPVKPWYPKDPDLIGRVARIVRLRRNRALWRMRRFVSATDNGRRVGYVAGWEDGSQWAIAQMRDLYRSEREHVFERVTERRMVSLGRDAGEMR